MPEPPISAHAGAELADRLREAWVRAGKPHMETMGDEVGYSATTISKVLSGRMPPAWHLVRKLGVLLEVPTAVIVEQWHPLWIAADNFRRAVPDAGPEWIAADDLRRAVPDAGPEWITADDLRRAVPDAGRERPEDAAGRVCDRCGSWVIDLSQHTEWHLQLEDRAIVRASDSLEWAHLRDAVSRRKGD
jgi:DNA-binding XRE family transcriptional regulator